MAKLLEVIVTSSEKAVEAEAGSADRLELACWRQRRARWIEWQTMTAPQVQMLVGIGVCTSAVNEPKLVELHVRRAARVPQTTSGVVNRGQSSALRNAFQ